MEPVTRPRIKICCIASPAEAGLAIEAGADAIGLVGRMPSGPGVITDEAIAGIARSVPPPIATFLLTSERSAEAIAAHHRRVNTTAIQIVDRPAEGTYAYLRNQLPGTTLVQVVHVTGPESLDAALAVAGEVDAILLDSGRPDMPVKELGGQAGATTGGSADASGKQWMCRYSWQAGCMGETSGRQSSRSARSHWTSAAESAGEDRSIVHCSARFSGRRGTRIHSEGAHHMLRHHMFLLLAAASSVAQPLSAGEPRGLAGLHFLIGVWHASGSGTPGEASGSAEFSPGLAGHIITRNSFAEYPPSTGKAGYRHEDLMVIYVNTDSTVSADYFDSEGHVIRYAVNTPAPGKAVFLSPALPAAPRYRLTYLLTPDGTLDGKFEVAPPGHTDEFATYLTWSSKPADRRGTPGN